MLRLAARYADRWNSYGTVPEMAERNRALDDACAAIGRDPGSIIRSLYGFPGALGADPWDSEGAFIEAVNRYRLAGIDEFILEPPLDHQWATMERICGEVIPALRAEG